MAKLDGQHVLIVSGARALGFAIAEKVAEAGAVPIIAARDLDRAKAAAAKIKGAQAVRIDILDESSFQPALDEIKSLDHVIVTSAAHHNVPVTKLDHDKLVAAFEAKIIGPLLLAKHVAPILPPTGSITLFSGVAAWNPEPPYTIMGIANGAVAYTVAHLAKELAPVRVNAVSPGIIDSGAWDDLGANKANFLAGAAKGTLVGRYGKSDDIAEAVLWLLSAGFVSGETIHVEGGARFA